MFVIDSREKSEALNFATLMNAMEITEKKLDPLFSGFSKILDVSVPIDEAVDEYSRYYRISKERLLYEYRQAKQAFSELRETDEIIKRGNKDYPPLLSRTAQAPRFLYVRGRKSLLSENRTVALVGSRNASDKSKQNTKRLAASLGRNGITVISGLAKGIDVTAHKAALDKGFNTIAVIGTHLNQYYPIENKDVQAEIEKRGLVVSQFPPAAKVQRWFFPLRNGVMSGLSLATVIMEAGETSGALKQADYALKQESQVLIPQQALEMESITWPEKYVKRGAVVVNSPLDVLRELANSNIFKMDKEPEQQTLEDYLKDGEEKQCEKADIDWLDPVSV